MGNLAGADLKLCTTEFFMHNKRIRGFNLENYVAKELSDENRRHYFKIIQDDINSGGEIFGTTVAKEFRLDEWNKAIDSVEECMHEGKVLLTIEQKSS